MTEEFRCIVSFPDGSPSFVNGFEAGILWQRMISGESPIENMCAYHVDNQSVFSRMASTANYDVEFVPYDEEWMMATFVKQTPRFHVIDGGKK